MTEINENTVLYKHIQGNDNCLWDIKKGVSYIAKFLSESRTSCRQQTANHEETVTYSTEVKSKSQAKTRCG